MIKFGLKINNILQKQLITYLDYIYQDTVVRRYQAQQLCLEYDPQAMYMDIGCQTGINTHRLAHALGTSHVVGADYNFRTLKMYLDAGVMRLRLDANSPLPFKAESFTVISAIDVIEHLVDPHQFVREAYRLLKPGGYLILATPNLASWHNIFALLLGLQPFSGPNLTTMLDSDITIVRKMHRQAYNLPEDGTTIEFCGEEELHRHIVVVAYRALLNLLRNEKFTIEYARGFGYYPFPRLFARFLAWVDPWHAHHMVVKARKII